ncbi:Rne/Rng family ribonuclease [Roseospira visakhapatnamensis]|uniref:Ribonuclease E n=1 Tax=Roseospira visakhapatnamensis TaxID=390880 RepID=A0A7W6W8P3_9PROT|nr:Rne/Rng family ribonuclease [Roseospira visakhapatnamensis]MBB4264602.1 ribonuclease E [Roseospira visakhapatnamensis]
MTKRMLIDTSHPEETRVVVLDGNRLEEFDVETSTKRQIKGNVYLAKIVRVEPSLQAAFVEYGGNRHGFLAFNEIHPDYYQIPVADRQALLAEQEARQRAADEEEERSADGGGNGAGEDVEVLGGEETVSAATPSIPLNGLRHYKIQEVIKRRQIVLVQVVKEERGNKGAALTTYLSLAGRYCVFMPNTARGGGVSRKISSQTDRRRLKSILGDLHGPAGGSVILRTAGAERSKAEIKRDFDFLMRQWEQIKDTTLKSIAPSLIHEEGNLIKRAMRDIYTRDIEEIIVDGEDGYRGAKDFMKMLTPSHARKVQPYRDHAMPLFHRFQVESQLDAMHSPVANLRSGGYLVFNQTEALVAIDVNSGKATKERHIEETALKTNLEAADEVARQLRLRDLAGLIVIDFIDMDDGRNNAAVERRLKEALKQDRARIQVGRISAFGLMEMSRQRLRPSLMETAFHTCRHCHGTGVVRSIESTAIHMLRVIEEEGVRRRSSEVTLKVPTPVALYILNNKRAMLAAIEARYDFRVVIEGDEALIIPDFGLDRVQAQRGEGDGPATASETAPVEDTHPEDEDETEDDGDTGSDAGGGTERANGEDDDATRASGKKRRRRRRRPRRDSDDRAESNDNTRPDDDGEDESRDDTAAPPGADASDASRDNDDDSADTDREDAETTDGDTETDGEGESRSRRPRRRRGGRRNRGRRGEETGSEETGSEETGGENGTDGPTPANDANDANGATDAADTDDSQDNGDGEDEGAVALMEAVETDWADPDAPQPQRETEPETVTAEERDDAGADGDAAADPTPAEAPPAAEDETPPAAPPLEPVAEEAASPAETPETVNPQMDGPQVDASDTDAVDEAQSGGGRRGWWQR